MIWPKSARDSVCVSMAGFLIQINRQSLSNSEFMKFYFHFASYNNIGTFASLLSNCVTFVSRTHYYQGGGILFARSQDCRDFRGRPQGGTGCVHHHITHRHLRTVGDLGHDELVLEVTVAEIGGLVLLAIIDIPLPF